MDTSLVKIIISVACVVVVYPITRYITYKLIDKVAKLDLYDSSHARMMKTTFNYLILVVLLTFLISLWGVDTRNLLVALSSVFAVIGVALFAQWSILSNITAGIVIFFSLHLRIGDRIKIHDKEMMIEATIKDLKLFYIHLETEEGEHIAYPNNQILQKGISIK
jgi:small-conductance mechanosensitive channel